MELAELIMQLNSDVGMTTPTSVKLYKDVIVYKCSFNPLCTKDYAEGYANALMCVTPFRSEVQAELLESLTSQPDNSKDALDKDLKNKHSECARWGLIIKYEVKDDAELNKIRQTTKDILAKQSSRIDTDLFEICFGK